MIPEEHKIPNTEGICKVKKIVGEAMITLFLKKYQDIWTRIQYLIYQFIDKNSALFK